jgi:hypothetical protein
VALAAGRAEPLTAAALDAEALVNWGKMHGLASLPHVPAIAMLDLAPGALAAATDAGAEPLARELGGKAERDG